MTIDSATTTAPGQEKQLQVWDLFVRVFQWTVAVAFLVAYLTEDELLTLQAWAGHTIGVLVVLRILWCFLGPKHARFSDFINRPFTVWAYAMGLLSLRAKR